MRLLPHWAVLFSATMLFGCYGHSFPETESFIYGDEKHPLPISTAEVFVDPNGTFYPSYWKRYLDLPPLVWREDSLLNQTSHDQASRHLIEKDEERQLAALRHFGSNKNRIFILVHGYNNEVNEARPAFEAIEGKIGKQPGDGVIRFYWDGLTAKGPFSFKIWFNAAGYSQLAGSRGLRRILDQFSNKTIYLIGHSRGSSVILSALGNPIYDPRFMAKTRNIVAGWGERYVNFLRPPELVDRRNNIHVLLMAPAVDFVDFCDVSQQPEVRGRFECGIFRPMGSQVNSLHYTVNKGDHVLNKIAGLGGNFNPTRLGLTPKIGESIAIHYEIPFQPYVFSTPEKWHKFGMYVEHPTFLEMLLNAGIKTPSIHKTM